jgi:hypothetical protein
MIVRANYENRPDGSLTRDEVHELLDEIDRLRNGLQEHAIHKVPCEWRKMGQPSDPEFIKWVQEWSANGSPCSCGLKELIES